MTAETTEVLAWHFLNDDRRLRYGSKELIKAGSIVTVERPIKLCAHGLHGSVRPMDALEYAPGPIVCRVKHSGVIIHGDDKLCSTVREVLWMDDATKVLHQFAVWCAEQALKAERAAGRDPDPRSWKALEVKLAWLEGNATDEELAAAWAAAWAAARDAAWAAARDAARAAAWAAARDAAWDAAWDAARAAAWAAARAAARDAAWDAQNTELERRLTALAPLDLAS